MGIAVRFFLVEDDAAFHLVATGNPDWSFTKFSPPFRHRHFRLCLVFLCTAAASTSLRARRGPLAGLCFNGSFDLNKCIGGLAGLLGRQVQPLTGEA